MLPSCNHHYHHLKALKARRDESSEMLVYYESKNERSTYSGRSWRRQRGEERGDGDLTHGPPHGCKLLRKRPVRKQCFLQNHWVCKTSVKSRSLQSVHQSQNGWLQCQKCLQERIQGARSRSLEILDQPLFTNSGIIQEGLCKLSPSFQ